MKIKKNPERDFFVFVFRPQSNWQNLVEVKYEKNFGIAF